VNKFDDQLDSQLDSQIRSQLHSQIWSQLDNQLSITIITKPRLFERIVNFLRRFL